MQARNVEIDKVHHRLSARVEPVKGIAERTAGNQRIGRDHQIAAALAPNDDQPGCHGKGQRADEVAAAIVEIPDRERDPRIPNVPDVEEGRDVDHHRCCSGVNGEIGDDQGLGHLIGRQHRQRE